MKALPFKSWSQEEHETWSLLFNRQAELRDSQVWDLFSSGIEALDMRGDRIPDLDDVNRRLKELTGFVGVPVEGFEEAWSFFEMLKNRQFPIGNFIRDRRDLSYTPAPDIFHDLYGHLPFLIDPDYADFCQDIGERTVKYREDPRALREFERLFWFTVEFAVMKTPKGRRIFGAGIASSQGECAYALSERPMIQPFDAEVIRNREFKIDEFQHVLFELDSPEQLYACLDEFERRVVGGGAT